MQTVGDCPEHDGYDRFYLMQRLLNNGNDCDRVVVMVTVMVAVIMRADPVTGVGLPGCGVWLQK